MYAKLSAVASLMLLQLVLLSSSLLLWAVARFVVFAVVECRRLAASHRSFVSVVDNDLDRSLYLSFVHYL